MIRDPFLARVHAVLDQLHRVPNEQSGPRAFEALGGALSNTKAGRDADEFVAEVAYGLSLTERRLIEAVDDEGMMIVHKNTLSRLRTAFSFSALQLAWQNYARQHLSPELVHALIALDRAVTVRQIPKDKIENWLNEIEHLRQKITSSSDVPVHLASLLIAQFDLIERAAKRFDLDGATGFREQVYCSLGVLELRLKEHDDALGIDVVKETLDWTLRVAGAVELGQQALTAIPFFSGVAGLITGPAG